ncbi:MAG: polyprenyl synthetase family protein [Euryarchaeota archaeon]|nr:polyprenyl synthetase family protein [Euryarchaeota archaeon]
MLQTFGLGTEMEQVEVRLRRSVASDEPLLTEMALYVIESGGKRVRPLAAVLSYRAVGGRDARLDDVLEMAAGLELIHSATLVHDDINDDARTRRGRDSLWRRYGRAPAIVTGDFLFTKGFHISGRFDNSIVDWTGDACRMLAEGEVLQSRYQNDPSLSVEDYLVLIERKTASIIQTGIRIGAYLGGADPATVERLGRFGLQLGLAFQIVDDILDVVGDGDRTGKRPGIDIQDGSPTIPLLLAIRRGGPDAERLADILRDTARTEADIDEALRIVRASGAVEEADAMARAHGTAARREIVALDGQVDHERLLTLVDLVLERDF